MARKSELTDADVQQELERLKNSPFVKLGIRENSIKQREKKRQYLYQLRMYEKRGKALAEKGVTLDTVEEYVLYNEIDALEQKSGNGK